MRRIRSISFWYICYFFLFNSFLFAKSPPSEIKDLKRAFLEGYFIVKGQGIAPSYITHRGRKILAARRAAVVDAQRNLAEVIYGTHILGQTLVKNAILKNDEIRSNVSGIIKGATIVYEKYDPNLEIFTVYLSLPIKGKGSLFEAIVPYISELSVSELPRAKLKIFPKKEIFDGLVVDARGTDFLPAVINRILSESGDYIYDPTKIPADVLVKRGCGDYTDKIGKAKAILKERGFKNPLIVKGIKAKNRTDIEISDKDAEVVIYSNLKENFLERAGVVFVLD